MDDEVRRTARGNSGDVRIYLPDPERARHDLTSRVHIPASHWGQLAAYSESANSARWTLYEMSRPLSQSVVASSANLLGGTRSRRLTFTSHTVSNFTDWIYSLYEVSRSPNARSKGRDAEPLILANRVPHPTRGSWDLVHVGMDTQPDQRPPAFRISALQIEGEPMRASPDLVFRESRFRDQPSLGDERVLIVEIKCTSADVPIELWPNVRAQLWAYSQIDDFRFASEIMLVGEVWEVSDAGVKLRQCNSWRATDPQLNAEGRLLFDAYVREVAMNTR